MTTSLLIAGTGTGVGKTVLTMAIASYWQRYYPAKTLGIFKPIQCNGTDRDRYHQLFNLDQSLDEITPVHAPDAPIPALAADRLPLELIWQQFQTLQQRDLVLVEAIGGLGTPISQELTVADLAWDWRLPTVLVVPLHRDAIAQAVTNVAFARRSRAHLKGIVLSAVQPGDWEIQQQEYAPAKLLKTLTQLPVLGCIPHLENPEDHNQLVAAAGSLDLERLMMLPNLPIAEESLA